MNVKTVECPAGICQKNVAVFDHDRMFGHLLNDHRWSFETAQSWVVEIMPDDAEEEERKLLDSLNGGEGENG